MGIKFVDDHPWPKDIEDFLHNNDFGQKVFKCLKDDYERIMIEHYEEALQELRERDRRIKELEGEVARQKKFIHDIMQPHQRRYK